MKFFSRKPRKTRPFPDVVLHALIAFFKTGLAATAALFFVIPITAIIELQGHGSSKSIVSLADLITGLGVVAAVVCSIGFGFFSAQKQKQDKKADRKAALEDAKEFEEWKRKRFGD